MDSPASALLETLRGWAASGALRALDLALTAFVHETGREMDEAVLLAIALASERNGHGHVCLDLGEALSHPGALLGRPGDDLDPGLGARAELRARLDGLSLSDWVARLAVSQAVDNRLNGSGHDTGVAPLVLAGTRERPLLYPRRYWGYEQRIRAGIAARLRRSIPIDETALRARLAVLFDADARPSAAGAPGVPPAPEHAGRSEPVAAAPSAGAPSAFAAGTPSAPAGGSPDWQRIACALAARSAFFIVTGGPGTGKTTTVVRLLALLQDLAAAAGQPPLRIDLAAPTGKAAARLNESIAAQVAGIEALRRRAAPDDGRPPPAPIPTQVRTLHRLLGSRPDSRRFRHHAGQPLPADVVVVDEASMVDVEMMACLLDALRPDARLILLGDKDQLASVEAGAVLGDLCARAARGHYRPETADWLWRAAGERIPETFLDGAGTPLDQAIAMLRWSHRFSPEGGIGALAAAVNAPDDRAGGDIGGDAGDAAGGDAGGGSGRLGAVLDLFARERFPDAPGAAAAGMEGGYASGTVGSVRHGSETNEPCRSFSPLSPTPLPPGERGQNGPVIIERCLTKRWLEDRDRTRGRIDAIQIRDPQDSALAELVRVGYAAYLDAIRIGPDAAPTDSASAAGASAALAGAPVSPAPAAAGASAASAALAGAFAAPASAPAAGVGSPNRSGPPEPLSPLDAWALRVLEAHRRFQVLTPLRRGPWGVEGLNQRILAILREAGLLSEDGPAAAAPARLWYPGRPVLVTRNDYSLNLMNGDIGIALRVPAPPGGRDDRPLLRVAFPSGDGRPRWILPSRLQWVETVFALTVHKSQGSEFDQTALILPDSSNPVLTRELLYTAITRSKRRFTLLHARPEVLGEALERRVRRVSGLGDLQADLQYPDAPA